MKVLEWTTGYFRDKGIDQPRACAEVLLAHCLGLERIQLYLNFDKPLSREELSCFRECVKRRAAREPTQYITGRQEFWSLEFEVNPHVLIPRPETEHLIERVLEVAGERKHLRVLDVATGSGAIAVSLARERPSWRLMATDISEQALATAARNAARHGVWERIELVCCDLLSGFRGERARFDLVVSNPPYIGEREWSELEPEVSDFEPKTALRGGGELGLELIRRIVLAAADLLEHGGHLLVEIGQGQAAYLKEILRHDVRYDLVEFYPDYAGILRVLDARRKAEDKAGAEA